MFSVGHVNPFFLSSCKVRALQVVTLETLSSLLYFFVYKKLQISSELVLWLGPFFLVGAHTMFLLLVVGY
jgi:hypothetical protein